ncbi:sulfatase-like hydrolase/transferase [Legionella bozemanae]|uniref:sulfatase-like hydrolase/transferase n=1 Tax=Legionella bozemanae TaxID=447 RepID=UPI003EEFB625
MDFKRSVVFALSLPLIIFLVAPLVFYLGNHFEFTTNLADTLPLLVFLCIGATAILLGLLLAISRWPMLYAIISGLLVGLALSTWVQSQLFAWDFGPLDGNGVNWSKWSTHANLELLVWLFLVSAAITLAFRARNKLLILAQGSLLLGILSLITAWVSSDYHPKKSVQAAKSLFSFHEKNNKILIILDSFQSDIFNEVTQNWPEEVAFLRGFTFYPNTVGGYPSTIASLPLILTGQFYKNEIPLKDWMKANYKTLNIADYHIEKGYGASIISIIASKYLEGIKAKKAFMASVGDETWAGISKQQLLLLNGGLFRIAPTKLKPKLYDKYNWLFLKLTTDDTLPQGRNGDDLRFLNALEKNAKINSNKQGEFKVYHYAGTHAPSQVNELFKYEKDMPATKDSYVRHARGVLRFLRSNLELLQKLGIYDSAEILVIGDHGRGFWPGDTPGSADALDDDINMNVLGAARPLFLYKPSASISPLTYSNKPLHLADIVCILSWNDDKFACGGDRLSKLDEKKKRTFLFYKWSNPYWKKTYLPPMSEYVINGDVRNIQSWKNLNREYAAGTVKKQLKFAEYKLGIPLSFTKGGDVENFLKQGWSVLETDHCWTDGSQSRLGFYVKQTKSQSLSLRLHARAFPTKDRKPQQIKVVVNGHQVASWRMLELDWFEATIPAKIINNGLLDITFVISEPTAPSEISESLDHRKLGIFAQEIIIDEISRA